MVGIFDVQDSSAFIDFHVRKDIGVGFHIYFTAFVGKFHLNPVVDFNSPEIRCGDGRAFCKSGQFHLYLAASLDACCQHRSNGQNKYPFHFMCN